MSQLPEIPRDPATPPAARLSPEQFEQVIRRAAELQARSADDTTSEGISHAELMRIGREIGISPAHLQRALAETVQPRGVGPTLADRLLGPGWAIASRTVPGTPDAVRQHVEQYLLNREWLGVFRRFPDRTVYHKGRGLDLARVVVIAQGAFLGAKQPEVGVGFKLRKARRVEVAVQPLEEGFSHLTLRADLTNYRAGVAVGMAGGVGLAGGMAAVLAVAVDPAAALLGLPILGGTSWGCRAIQSHSVEHARSHLEALLDCLERGEPLFRPSKHDVHAAIAP